jgi:hypothetical protein
MLAVVSAAAAACSDPAPEAGALAFVGLEVGAAWTYRNVDHGATGGPLETTVVKEITGCEDLVLEDCVTNATSEFSAYVQVTTGGAAEDDDANTLYMVDHADGLVRVRQDVVNLGVLSHVITYSPYFMRLFAGPYDRGRTEEIGHERCSFSPAGEPLAQEQRRYRHEVVAADAQVSVPYGDYDGALHMKRTDLSDHDSKEYWFVPGVGKVLERAFDENGTLIAEEELADFRAGDGSCE